MRAVSGHVDTLGESPVWSAAEQALYWVDIRAPALHRLDAAAGTVASWPMPDLIGAVMLRERGGLVLGLKTGLFAFDRTMGRPTLLLPVDEGHSGNRINDSRCDRAGRLWFSTMWDFGRHRTGSLYRVDADLHLERVLGAFTVPNALCFSPAGDRAYIADTALGTIDVLEIEPASGAVRSRRPFIEARRVPGKPDGATVDAEGFVWNARFGAGLLARFAPDGRLDRLVELPVSQPTSCSFGGSRLETLFVTTATQGLDEPALLSEPLAGAVLAFEPGVHGLPEPAFAG